MVKAINITSVQETGEIVEVVESKEQTIEKLVKRMELFVLKVAENLDSYRNNEITLEDMLLETSINSAALSTAIIRAENLADEYDGED